MVVDGWEEEEVGRAEEGREPIALDTPREVDTLGEAEAARLCCQRLLQVAVAEDDEACRAGRADGGAGKGVDRDIEALLVDEPPARQDQSFPLAQTKLATDRRA